MANDNKKTNKLVCEQDDDTTTELELLSEEGLVSDEAGDQVEAEPDAKPVDFEMLGSEVDDADETIATMKLGLRSHPKSISKLYFDIERLRSRWK